MAARGYEFYLRVLKVSVTGERGEQVRDTFSTRSSFSEQQKVIIYCKMSVTEML